jgi:hypothetical protein
MPLSEGEMDALRDACRRLPPAEGVYLEDDFITNVVVTVVDFQMRTTAVVKAMEHFKQHARPTLATLADLQTLIAQHPDDKDGNTAVAQSLWGYNLWTRAHMLRLLVAFFDDIGVTSQLALRDWTARTRFKDDFEGRVKGLGPAVFNWLRMRQGENTIKPDVHVLRFTARVIGRRASDNDVVAALIQIAQQLDLKAYALDSAIWEHERRDSSDE